MWFDYLSAIFPLPFSFYFKPSAQLGIGVWCLQFLFWQSGTRAARRETNVV